MQYDFVDYMSLTSDSQSMLDIENKINIDKDNDFFSVICYEPLECSDGSLISIQAGKSMGCIPKENLPLKEYTHFEIKIEKKDAIFEYLRMEDDDLIFFCTPKEDIYKYLEKHGHLKKWLEGITKEKEILLNEFPILLNNNNKNKNRI